jgi:hypothetical protein
MIAAGERFRPGPVFRQDPGRSLVFAGSSGRISVQIKSFFMKTPEKDNRLEHSQTDESGEEDLHRYNDVSERWSRLKNRP